VLVRTIDLKGASGCPGMRLGDINGDGKLEIVVAQPVDQASLDAYTPQLAVAVTAFDLRGNQLWQYGKPNSFHTASSDIPVQVYDMDGDGKAEIFVNMSRTEMSVLDGSTGKLLRKIPLPEAGSNDSIAFANLRGTAWPQDIIVKTRYSQFWAITGVASDLGPAGTVLWTHRKGPATGFSDLSTGHFPLVYDWNGDGKDEVMGGYDFMDSSGNTQWSSTTLKLHADSLTTGDMDGNPANGKEIIICGDVAAAYDWKTGKRLWQDNHTTEVQQMGMGDYRPDLPGLEVVLLDRLRTAAEGLKSNNWLVDQHDAVLWHEDRPNNSGWLTVTENLNNWDGSGGDFIFSYRRGTGGAYLYDGYQKTVATFTYPGTQAQNFTQHANLCGDDREEVILYDENTAWIYANGGCDLDAPSSKPSLPQQYHLYNWSIYTGWITPDPKFFTPGSKQ
jgi:FG-GAP-like repeat